MSEIFAPGSIAGPAGPPATFMGPYNSGTTYAIGHAAGSNGSSYVSLVAGNIGHDPATSPAQWSVLAAAGTPGINGANGANGANGTNGTNGAPGAPGLSGSAGSAAAITALAGALMPGFVGRNLFDVASVRANTFVNLDGTLSANASTNASNLIYCPGATSMVGNLAINIDNWGGAVCLYDANGTFISALEISAFSATAGGASQGYAAFALPGTQTYVRFSTIPSWETGSYDRYPEAGGMIYATVTGTASLPLFQPFGVDTVADVNAKDAVVAANAAAALVSTTRQIGTALGLFAKTVLPSPSASNAFDSQKILHDTSISPLGVPTASAGYSSAMVFAPGATQFTTNLPIRGTANGFGLCLYDAFGNFLQEISAVFGGGPLITPGNVYTLPGTQTFIMFTYSSGNFGWGPESNGAYFVVSESAGQFLVGTATSPCPTALPQGAPHYSAPTVHVQRASQLGCALDSNFNTGGGTDNTLLLNAFLATASVTNPIKLILDGVVCVSAALQIAPTGYTTIEGIGWGSGLVILNDTYSVVLGTQTQGNYNQAAPARTATNIAIRNFTVKAWGNNHVAMMLSSCSNVIVENMNFPNALAGNDFMVTITNANQVSVRGCSFTSTGSSHDGIHIDGKCEDITISDCYFATGDDAIALNAPEGYGGDITRVTVTNCVFNGSLTVMRIYTSLDVAHMPTNNVHKVRNVVVSNCAGWVHDECFNLGITNGGLSSTTDVDQIQDLTVSNCSFAAPLGLALILDTFGLITFSSIRFIPTGSSALINGYFSSGGELLLNDVCVMRNGDGSSPLDAFVYMYGGVAWDRVTLINCRAVDQLGSSYTAHTSLIDCGGTIARLRLESVDLTNVTALFGAGGNAGIAAMVGHGVIGTGAQVPDSIMGNNALYLSSNASGAPSIKVGGVAKRITLA